MISDSVWVNNQIKVIYLAYVWHLAQRCLHCAEPDFRRSPFLFFFRKSCRTDGFSEIVRARRERAQLGKASLTLLSARTPQAKLVWGLTRLDPPKRKRCWEKN